jgi:hypothetical protein
MATSLKELYDAEPSMLSIFTDPRKVQDLAKLTADQELGQEAISGGSTDALRHLLGSATAHKVYGQPLADSLLNWHENPNIPQNMYGGRGQREVERLMDLHNNDLGKEIAQKAKTYDEALEMAKQYVTTKRVKLAPPPEPAKPIQAVAEHDKNYTFKEWFNKYMSK